ncbi:MAG: response regulator transcription factor [Thermodesulfovibrionales bacterium]
MPKSIRVLIARDSSLFCEGLIGLIGKDSAIEVVAQVEELSQVKSIAAGRPDVLVLCSSLFSAEELPSIVQTLKRKSGVLKILILLKEDLADEALMHFLMIGADGYVRKSASSDQLIQAIRAVFAGGVWAERGLLNKFVKSPVLSLDVEQKLLKFKDPLTRREKEIISLLFLGLSNRAIGDRLFISEKTVKTHLGSIFRKMNVSNRSQVLAFLIR